MEIHKDKETFTLVVSRDELIEIKDALGSRCLYLEALHRKKKKNAIARSKAVSDDDGTIQKGKLLEKDRPRKMYMQITGSLE